MNKYKNVEESEFGKLLEDLIKCEVNERMQSAQQKALMNLYSDYRIKFNEILDDESKDKFIEGLRNKIKSDVMMEIMNRIFPEGNKFMPL